MSSSRILTQSRHVPVQFSGGRAGRLLCKPVRPRLRLLLLALLEFADFLTISFRTTGNYCGIAAAGDPSRTPFRKSLVLIQTQ